MVDKSKVLDIDGFMVFYEWFIEEFNYVLLIFIEMVGDIWFLKYLLIEIYYIKY